MKKLVVLLSILAIVSGCRFWKGKKQSLPYSVLENKKAVEDTAYYKVFKNFPEFISQEKKTKKNLTILNQAIVNFTDTLEQYYWGTNPEGAKQIKNETQAAGIFELLNKYQILDTTHRFISIKFETYSYALGAHGFTGINTFNFDIKNNRFIQLTDIISFTKPENLIQLNNLVQKNFKNPDSCFNTQPAVSPDFNKFGISREYLYLYYEAYELGAYYCGSATIKIPVNELKEYELWVLGNAW